MWPQHKTDKHNIWAEQRFLVSKRVVRIITAGLQRVSLHFESIIIIIIIIITIIIHIISITPCGLVGGPTLLRYEGIHSSAFSVS